MCLIRKQSHSYTHTMDPSGHYCTKETLRGGAHQPFFQYGASGMQGLRPTMEDAHVIEPQLPNLPQPHALFCVLDGHGGTEASEFASRELTRILCDNDAFQTYSQLMATTKIRQRQQQAKQKNGKKASAKTKNDDKKHRELLERALTQSLVELDRELYLEHYYGEGPIGSSPGTTVVAALLTPALIICANLGDSRCVLASSSTASPTSVTALAMSQDHKPELPSERERIARAGGIEQDGRVDGELAVSRALGDFEFKNVDGLLLEEYDPTDTNDVEQLLNRALQQKVTAVPEIRVHYRQDTTDRFLILACDGIFDVASNQDCVEWIADLLHEKGQSDLGMVCEHILDICLQRGSQDNMTIIVVLLGEAGQKLIGRKKN